MLTHYAGKYESSSWNSLKTLFANSNFTLGDWIHVQNSFSQRFPEVTCFLLVFICWLVGKFKNDKFAFVSNIFFFYLKLILGGISGYTSIVFVGWCVFILVIFISFFGYSLHTFKWTLYSPIVQQIHCAFLFDVVTKGNPISLSLSDGGHTDNLGNNNNNFF